MALTREQVDVQWQRLIEGVVSREAVFDWARPWVEGKTIAGPDDDPMALAALQYLHGYYVLRSDATADGFARSAEDMASDLRRWRERCEWNDNGRGMSERALSPRAVVSVSERLSSDKGIPVGSLGGVIRELDTGAILEVEFLVEEKGVVVRTLVDADEVVFVSNPSGDDGVERVEDGQDRTSA